MNQEVFKLLKTRRSIRSFQPRQIAEDDLLPVLEAATYAPTGNGLQSPVMVVVQDPTTVAQLVEMNAKLLGLPTNPYYGAPTIVVVLAPRDIDTHYDDGCSVLCYLEIAANAAGLGCVWVWREKEMFQTPEGRALIQAWGLPDNMEGVGAIAMGYPAVQPDEAPPRKEDYILWV